jgi:hypothetical protein
VSSVKRRAERRERRVIYASRHHNETTLPCTIRSSAIAAIQTDAMHCRDHCGACCIAPSITTPIPGMPNGKPAGVSCIQLDADMRCRIFGMPGRPACCAGLQASAEMCGSTRAQALVWLAELERATAPAD